MSDVPVPPAAEVPAEDPRLQELRLYAAQLERYAEEFGALFHRYKMQEAELEAATLAVVNAFVVALGAHDAYTRDHTQRVQRSALMIARTLGWSDTQLEEVRLGAVLHDIGKTSISDTVLCKPGRLSDTEYRNVQRHPVIGAHMISGFPALTSARPYVLYHHERFDGTGYPAGLRGRDIPIQGRLLAGRRGCRGRHAHPAPLPPAAAAGTGAARTARGQRHAVRPAARRGVPAQRRAGPVRPGAHPGHARRAGRLTTHAARLTRTRPIVTA
ncbi:HD-GYP domain-containing protein [Deinococcus sp. RM]|uniref:HD-GYP domain-containing protein n=1 Tax=Deinococcus sp. RM TaxID=2316359 RepID=UPI000E69B56A|nr:HD domain-containing phosphohydrolase [Deinococcus sp. RM]RIY14499.1 HD domain-containing protein [Deinococcus sp. RM]